MKRTYILQGLDCANCAAKIEREVKKIDGVTNAVVSFMTTRMTIEAESDVIDEVCQKAVAIVGKLESDVVCKRR